MPETVKDVCWSLPTAGAEEEQGKKKRYMQSITTVKMALDKMNNEDNNKKKRERKKNNKRSTTHRWAVSEGEDIFFFFFLLLLYACIQIKRTARGEWYKYLKCCVCEQTIGISIAIGSAFWQHLLCRDTLLIFLPLFCTFRFFICQQIRKKCCYSYSFRSNSASANRIFFFFCLKTVVDFRIEKK